MNARRVLSATAGALFLFFAWSPARAAKTSAGSGYWSVPSLWSPAGVPLAVDSVTIRPGDMITVDITTATASTMTVAGGLIFSRVTDSSVTLVAGDLNVSAGGVLDMGNEATPIPPGINAHLVLASGTYAGQYGLIVNNGGNFTVRGSTKTPYSYATQDITTSDSSLAVYGSTSTDGWQVGDLITIGPTSGNGTATTDARTIASITGGPLYTIAWSGGTLPQARILTANGPIIVANLTRNAMVRSSGTVVSGAGGNSAYIQNLAQNTTSFALTHGEFAYLGANLASQYGVTFDGALARGSISSSTVRNGYNGIRLTNSSNNTLTGNNFYSNSRDGIFLYYSSGNTLTGNNSHSNSNSGFFLQDSSNNTLTGSNSYSNSGRGIYIDGSSSSNTLTRNNFYSNSSAGIGFFSNGDSNSTLTGNNSYSNLGYGIYLRSSVNTLAGNSVYSNSNVGIYSNASANAIVGGDLGYDGAGNSRPNTTSEIYFNSAAGAATLILKGARICSGSANLGHMLTDT